MLFSLLSSILGATIVSNVILQGIGLESISQKEIRVKNAWIHAGIISIIATLIFLIDYLVVTFILKPLSLDYLNLVILSLLVILMNEAYQYVVSKIKFNLPKDTYFSLHSVVFLVGFMALGQQSFDLAFIEVIGSLLGFIGFTLLLTMIKSRMRVNPLIKSFKGLPILLIILGLIALILNGLSGIF